MPQPSVLLPLLPRPLPLLLPLIDLVLTYVLTLVVFLLQSVVSDDHENTDDTQSCQISGDVRNHHNCLTSSPETNTSTRQQFHSDLPSNLSDISKSDENNAEKSSEDKSILMCDQDDKNAGEEDTNNVCKK